MAERETERTVKKRAESDPAYQWHIQDLYASDEVWEKDYEACLLVRPSFPVATEMMFLP